MSIKYGADIYCTRFLYSSGEEKGKKALQDAANKQITTTCVISIRRYKEHTVMATGEATRHKTDVFKKSEGRRIALARAARRLDNRELRQKIWDEYFANHKDGKGIVRKGK